MKKILLTLLTGLGALQIQAARFAPLQLGGALSQPVFALSEPGTNLIWVLEKTGRLRRIGSQLQTLLDVSRQPGFTSSGEQGLLGVAVDPDFLNNGFLYFYESSSTGSDTGGPASLIVRYQYTAADAVIDANSRTIVFKIPQETYSNHKGGMIAFGPDSHLYVGTGDGGSGGDPHGNAQNKASLLGKILRFQVTNGTLAAADTNPFVNQPNARGEIWAYGLRNPWRFSFDKAAGDLWLGDVGQGAFEEINLINRGGNYGWNIKEGPEDYENPNRITPPDYVPPVHSYRRSLGSAIVGGYVYRGRQIPALAGKYIFGDYGSARVWGLSNGTAVQLGSVQGLVSFGETESGELLAVSIMGQIFQILP